MSKGWILDEQCHEHESRFGEVWFTHAATRNEARRILSSAYDVPYLETVVYRYPIIDDIEHVTPMLGLYLGIFDWYGCHGTGCFREVRADDWDTLYSQTWEGDHYRITFGVVDSLGSVYCSPECAGFEPDEFTTGRIARAKAEEDALFADLTIPPADQDEGRIGTDERKDSCRGVSPW